MVPTMPNPIYTAGQAISGNIGNLASLYQLGGSLNKWSNQQAAAPFLMNLPDYQSMVEQSSKNIMSNLKGEVAPDVISELLQGAAERGISTGGGPNANAAYLRALGLTSLGLQKTGEQELTGAIARTPQGKPFDPTTMLVGPQQEQEAAYQASVLASSPDPAAHAKALEDAANRGIAAGGSVGGLMGVNRGAPAATTPFTYTGGFGAAPAMPTGGEYTATNDPYAAWNAWMSSPGVTLTGSTQGGGGGTGGGYTYMGANNPWAGINPEDYAYATGSSSADTGGQAYDYAAMYAAAGVPYVDWNAQLPPDYWDQFQ